LKLGEEVEEERIDDANLPADDVESEEEPSTSRGKGKATKVKAKAAEPKPKEKTAASRPRSKGKAKTKTKAAEPPAEGEPVAAEPPATGTAPPDGSPGAPAAGAKAVSALVPPGAKASGSKSKPASKQKAKEKFRDFPVTVLELEDRIPQFDGDAYGIMDEMDPEFDEEISALRTADSPDMQKYVQLELERANLQHFAIERKGLGNSEAMNALEARRIELEEWVKGYGLEVRFKDNDGTWTDPSGNFADLPPQEGQVEMPVVFVDEAGGAGVNFDYDGDVNMLEAEGGE
jgi:hypothetical protein